MLTDARCSQTKTSSQANKHTRSSQQVKDRPGHSDCGTTDRVTGKLDTDTVSPLDLGQTEERVKEEQLGEGEGEELDMSEDYVGATTDEPVPGE